MSRLATDRVFDYYLSQDRPIFTTPNPSSDSEAGEDETTTKAIIKQSPYINLTRSRGKKRKHKTTKNGKKLSEKQLKRRKQNREAAQRARDRKIQYTQQLEARLLKLEKENKKLKLQL